MAKRSYEMDMCRGPLAGKILMFSLPLIFSGILQLLFNAADLVVVGKFAGDISDQALAAVGSTGSVTNLITGAFIGLSTGANVLVAQLYGASDHQKLSKAVHTAITLAFISGVVLVGVGLLVARPLLEWMETPADVIDLSELYMRIIFYGVQFRRSHPAKHRRHEASALLSAHCRLPERRTEPRFRHLLPYERRWRGTGHCNLSGSVGRSDFDLSFPDGRPL